MAAELFVANDWHVRICLLGFIAFASSQPLLAAILKYFVDGLTMPTGSTVHDIPLLGKLDLAYGVALMLILIVIWQGLAHFPITR